MDDHEGRMEEDRSDESLDNSLDDSLSVAAQRAEKQAKPEPVDPVLRQMSPAERARRAEAMKKRSAQNGQSSSPSAQKKRSPQNAKAGRRGAGQKRTPSADPLDEDAQEVRTQLQLISSGDLGLSETFWVYLVSISIVINFVGLFSGPLYGTFAVAAAGWSVFMVKPVFLAAQDYQGLQLWGILARVVAVLVAIIFIITALTSLF